MRQRRNEESPSIRSRALFAAGLLLSRLARAKNCVVCHSVERKLVRPSDKGIAKRYADQARVAAKLAEKIIKGGKGVWEKELGAPVPPNTSAKPAEVAHRVQWILEMK